MIELTREEALNMGIEFWDGRHTDHVDKRGHVWVLTRAEVKNKAHNP